LTLITQGKKLFLVLGEVVEYRRALIKHAGERNRIMRFVRND
jgi:hypothetical protein